MKWTYKGLNYSLDIKSALFLIGFLYALPAIVAWGNNIDMYVSWWSLIGVVICGYLIYKNCVISYVPHSEKLTK